MRIHHIQFNRLLMEDILLHVGLNPSSAGEFNAVKEMVLLR